MKHMLIVAGSIKEYHDFMKELIKDGATYSGLGHNNTVVNDVRYVYAFMPAHFKGIHDADTKFIGTYQNRENLDELQTAARIAKMKPWSSL